MEIYDVIVVGAGPSGSTCARLCSKSGLKTLLIDKESFPRIKPCGGAISELGLSYLDFRLPDDLIEKECFGVRLHYNGFANEVVKDSRIAVLVSREKFDSYLLEKAKEAGVNVILGKMVSEIKIERDYAAIKIDDLFLRCSIVVGADGVNSIVSRCIRKKPYEKDELLLAMYGRIYEDNKIIDEKLDKVIDIYFGDAKFGYGWVFPHNGYYSVGIGGLYSIFHDPKEAYLNFIKSLGLKSSGFKGYFLPIGGVNRDIFGERIILVGDSAGFVDPFTGEGIAYAIHSGKIASIVILNSIKNKNYSKRFLLKSYKGRFKTEKSLKKVWLLTKIIHKYPDIFLKYIATDKEIIEKYCEIPAGHITYDSFIRWLLPRLSKHFLLKSWKG